MKRSIVALALLASCFSEEDTIGSESSSSSGSPVSNSSTESTTIATTIGTTNSADTSSDEGSSSSDSTGAADTSTSSTSESTGDPITDWALYFDGTNPATSTSDLDLALGNEFTVEAWVRVDSADALGTIASFLGVGTSGWSFGFNFESNLDFGFYDNNGAWNAVAGTNASSLSPGWTHVAAIKSGTSIYLYVDGVLVQTAPSSLGTSSPTVPLVLGDGLHGMGQYFALDDLRISTGRRYQVNFEPEHDLAVDADARMRALLDEGEGTVATCDGSLGATIDLVDPMWVEGDTP